MSQKWSDPVGKYERQYLVAGSLSLVILRPYRSFWHWSVIAKRPDEVLDSGQADSVAEAQECAEMALRRIAADIETALK